MKIIHNKKNVTRKTIAQLTGTSVSVVSRALNNSGYVEKSKKEAIIKAAKENNYFPHPVAMSLQQQKTKQILFFCKDLYNAFNIELYYGMLREAGKHDYMVLINADISFEKIKQTMVDGVVFQNEYQAAEYSKEYGKNYYLPAACASYGYRPDAPRVMPIVEINMYEATAKAIDYLQKNGHRKIASASICCWEDSNPRTVEWKDRLGEVLGNRIHDYFIGINRDELVDDNRMKQFDYDVDYVTKLEEKFFEKGILAADIFIERKLDATAIICFNDEMAFGFIMELQRLGKNVPADVSVMGFDATSRRKYISPLVTSIGLQPTVQGEKLAKTVIDVIEGNKYHYVSHSPTKFMPGESVKKII